MIRLLCFFLLASGTLLFAQTAEEWERRGDAASRQLKTMEALADYQQADNLAPNQVQTLCKIAREHALSMRDCTRTADKLQRGQTALGYGKRAVALNPASADAQLTAAICYGRLAPLLDNKTKLAYSKLVKEHADQSMKLNPNNDLTYHVLGAWNYELANLNVFMRAIASTLYGKLPNASNQEALRLLQKAIALNPDRLGNHVEIGKIYLALGQKENARAAMQKALGMPSVEKDDEHEKDVAREFLKKI